MGAVNPETGDFVTLIMPYSDTGFQYFLDYLNSLLNGAYCFMILDNAT